jgi:hypothetical protein
LTSLKNVELCSLEKAVDRDIFESKLVSLLRVDELCLVDAASARLKTLFADLEVETVLYLLTIIRIVLPGMAGVGAEPFINCAILSI